MRCRPTSPNSDKPAKNSKVRWPVSRTRSWTSCRKTKKIIRESRKLMRTKLIISKPWTKIIRVSSSSCSQPRKTNETHYDIFTPLYVWIRWPQFQLRIIKFNSIPIRCARYKLSTEGKEITREPRIQIYCRAIFTYSIINYVYVIWDRLYMGKQHLFHIFGVLGFWGFGFRV